ncbi:MAG: C45 family autoproteolytic acyltransferase/hydrolase [Pseudomonadota bacterium]|nr:C45 family autoproteolytic acyltransferase/hydrolase [Pseudomonadota bacterium]
MQKRFVALREDRPGRDWLARFNAGRDEAEHWYLGAGRGPPATPDECRAALRRHMPELLTSYDHVCALVGDDERAHQMLSHYRPPPLLFGCTQAVWLGSDGPALVRNYDFPIGIVSDHFESTSWFGREVISKAQRPWGGCLDGMNADGLVASATFGGNPAQGLGFSIILILRYVLETCRHVAEGVDALRRIPVALSQNVTLLDKSGAYATMFLGPERVPTVSQVPVCTNHQEVSPPIGSAIAAGTTERQQGALRALEDPGMTLENLTASFLVPPLYSRNLKSPTVYSAVYRPAALQVDYLWPGKCWAQRIGHFASGEYTHDYGVLV